MLRKDGKKCDDKFAPGTVKLCFAVNRPVVIEVIYTVCLASNQRKLSASNVCAASWGGFCCQRCVLRQISSVFDYVSINQAQ